MYRYRQSSTAPAAGAEGEIRQPQPASRGRMQMIDAAEALADYRRRHPGPLPASGGRVYRQHAPELIRCTIRPATAETWLQPHFHTPQAKTILLEISARYAAVMEAGA